MAEAPAEVTVAAKARRRASRRVEFSTEGRIMSIATAAKPVDEVDGIMDRVAGWPTEGRLALAQRILQSVQADLKERPRRKSFMTLLGQLKVEGPPPSNQDYRAILEEELIKKYGS
jgi:hypothetical protein